jgi:hypothetical protein
MTGVWITLALGALIIIFDYYSATKPDPKDKYKRRRPLSPTNIKLLRDLVVGTLVAAAAVWWLSNNWV